MNTVTIQNKLKRVAIIAPTGMLGNGVYSVLKDRYSLVLIFRDKNKLKLLENLYGKNKGTNICFDINTISKDASKFKNLIQQIGPVDAIINCSGIINKYAEKDILDTFFLNSVFPQLLSQKYKEKLIHITTDCVFDGTAGFPYNEKSTLSAMDVYGISKWLGEPKDSLILRTSIIGTEISGFVSLLEWARKQKNKTIRGYSGHYWNGITARQFGKVCDMIIKNRRAFPKNGVYHIFGSKISKYEMLVKINKKYELGCNIIKDSSTKCNRTLSTIYGVNKKLKIPSFDTMLKEL